jgi:pyridoxamine 5'-phosphate oxidase
MTLPPSIADLRREYARARLDEKDVSPDPFVEFARWFAEAQAAEAAEVNAMVLATASADGRPSARMVLLKGFDKRGFVFFTDYRSRKAEELEENLRAALGFYWSEHPSDGESARGVGLVPEPADRVTRGAGGRSAGGRAPV